MSPRSGTPVKLLGREDASVDWYNLEKSKRVKAFRCGEFDACIEKAEAARGTPIKKREKYARREDAIIHALELEKQILERKLTKLGGSMPTNYSGTIKKEPAVDFPSEGHVMADDTSASGKLTKCRKVGLPVATKGKSLSAVGGIGDTLFSNQDCSSDGVPRIKFMDGSYTHGNKKGFSPSKNRRPLGGFAEESKRRDKRRPLLQVMQSSAKLQSSPSVACDEYATDQMKVWSSRFGYDSYLQEENAFSGLIERYESQLPENLYLDPDMEQQDALLSSTSQSFARELASLGRNDEYGHKMVHVLEQDGCPNRSVGLVSGRAFENNKGDVGVSRWNLKGKRNIRKLSKRPENLQGGRNIYNDTRGRSIQKDLYSQTGDSDDDDFVERGLQSEFDPIDDVRCQQAFQGSSMDFTDDSMDGSDKDSEGISLPDWDNEKLHHAPRRREWDMGQQFGHVYMGDFHDRMESRLVDVDLKVQASYQGERVPLVSLMSRLNGKAIVGHPLQVEIVSDGLTFTLLSDNDSGGNPSGSLGATTQPVWPTGRRSSMPRIPRPHTASSMEVEGGSGIHHHADLDGRVTSKRPLHFNSDDRIKSKKTSHSRRPAKKSHKKSSKKASLSNLKTRTLSSLAKGQKHATAQSKGGKLSNRTGSLSILMKPGETVPTVAWVPVKVVFSRILEAVGRSPSNPLAHRHLLTGTGSNDGKS